MIRAANIKQMILSKGKFVSPEIHDASLGRGVTGLAGSRAGSRECRGPGVANQGCCDPNAGIQEFRGQGAEIQECWDERLQGVATYYNRECEKKYCVL